MQLTPKNQQKDRIKPLINVNTALAAATCALLGTAPIVQAEEDVWEMRATARGVDAVL